jgi:hypothetical protein
LLLAFLVGGSWDLLHSLKENAGIISLQRAILDMIPQTVFSRDVSFVSGQLQIVKTGLSKESGLAWALVVSFWRQKQSIAPLETFLEVYSRDSSNQSNLRTDYRGNRIFSSWLSRLVTLRTQNCIFKIWQHACAYRPHGT